MFAQYSRLRVPRALDRNGRVDAEVLDEVHNRLDGARTADDLVKGSSRAIESYMGTVDWLFPNRRIRPVEGMVTLPRNFRAARSRHGRRAAPPHHLAIVSASTE